MKKWICNCIVLIIFFIFLCCKEIIFYRLLPKDDYCILETQYKELEQKYLDIVEELELPLDYNHQYQMGFILFQDPLTYLQEITILTKNTVQEKSAVVNKLGLVGVVISNDTKSSQVQLLTHKDTTLSIKVGTSSGVLRWVNGELIIDSIIEKSPISIGDVVVTSGLTSIPGEIVVGRIISLVSSSVLEKKYKVELAADITDSKYIYVLNNRVES